MARVFDSPHAEVAHTMEKKSATNEVSKRFGEFTHASAKLMSGVGIHDYIAAATQFVAAVERTRLSLQTKHRSFLMPRAAGLQ